MKKNLVFILLTLAALASCASSAFAARLVKEPLGWFHSGTKFDRLTVASTFGDTTAFFSTEGWASPFNSSADTVVVGYLVVEMDTAATVTSDLTVFTSKVLSYNDPLGYNVAVTLAPGTQTLTSGTKLLTFPIWYSAAKAYRAAHVNAAPFSGRVVRFLLLGGTGSMPAAKVSILRWSD